jgi:hypothetical protein
VTDIFRAFFGVRELQGKTSNAIWTLPVHSLACGLSIATLLHGPVRLDIYGRVETVKLKNTERMGKFTSDGYAAAILTSFLIARMCWASFELKGSLTAVFVVEPEVIGHAMQLVLVL